MCGARRWPCSRTCCSCTTRQRWREGNKVWGQGGGSRGGGQAVRRRRGGASKVRPRQEQWGGNARPSSINAPLRYLLISYLHLAP